jgi:hypothetical protein
MPSSFVSSHHRARVYSSSTRLGLLRPSCPSARPASATPPVRIQKVRSLSRGWRTVLGLRPHRLPTLPADRPARQLSSLCCSRCHVDLVDDMFPRQHSQWHRAQFTCVGSSRTRPAFITEVLPHPAHDQPHCWIDPALPCRVPELQGDQRQ